MAFNAKVATQEFEEQAINVASDLAHVDVNRSFESGLSSDIEPGTLLKENGSGNLTPWIQGTDAAADIVGVYAGVSDLDTTERQAALFRIFGPVRSDALISWTAADGSTTADPSADAITALQDLKVFPM